jgi:transglutaminase-like putative cysteine protease
VSQTATIRLGVFAALAAFAGAHWVTLVEDPPVGGTMLAVAVAVAGSVAMALIAGMRLDRRIAWCLAGAVSLAVVAVALVAMGLPAALLDPERWGELFDGIDQGFHGISRDVDYPYAGANEWSRLVLLFGLPVALGLATTLAFWPSERPRSTRLAGVGVLVAAWATAAAADPTGESLLFGIVLLALIAAWLWLPSLSTGAALTGARLLGVAGLAALPLAAILDADEPWLDYTSWNLSGASATVDFRWDHSYGPLDWPRDGTPLLEIESNEPHYWRAVVLDRFDGYRWVRSESEPREPLERPSQILGDRSGGLVSESRWLTKVEVTIAGLAGEFLVSPGSAQSINGMQATTLDDGTTLADTPVEEGDTYSVLGYAPEPDLETLEGAPQRYAPALRRYTRIELPRPGGLLGEEFVESAVARTLTVPLRGGTADPEARRDARRILAGSPYGDVARSARAITAGETTVAGAANAVQEYLLTNYTYVEDVPIRQLPLRAFLLTDEEGYCQQFSGAMALMLRMLGIPARVATGFAPGQAESSGVAVDHYVVRDFDAHSWVEVYFPGIGWAPFDPTPVASPAIRTADIGAAAFGGLSGELGPTGDEPGGTVRSTNGSQGKADASSEGMSPLVIAAAVGIGAIGLVAIGLVGLLAYRGVRYRSLTRPARARAQLGEIEGALPRLGFPLPGGITLLSLEGRVGRTRPATAAYLAKLRAGRFGPGASPLPTPAERRGVRRELTAGRGLIRRLRGLLAIPPGAPAR